MNKVCLWVRKYLRETILGISLGVFIGLSLGALFALLHADIREPIIWYPVAAAIGFSFIAILLSGFWYRIPCQRIQQNKHPDKWVVAQITGIDTSRFEMFHGTPYMECDYIDFTVALISSLPFDIEFTYLKGIAIVNGTVTHSVLESKDNIKLTKHGSAMVNAWRLHNWANCLSPSYTGIHIEFILSGVDTKHRPYKLTTRPFSYGTYSQSNPGL